MENNMFYGMSITEMQEFVKNCVERDDLTYLRIKNTELAIQFQKICRNFEGASLLTLFYSTGNYPNGVKSSHKDLNNIILNLGVHTFLPELRFGESYWKKIQIIFEDIIELSMVPGPIGGDTEIQIVNFSVENNLCNFTAVLKNDLSKHIKIKSNAIYFENFLECNILNGEGKKSNNFIKDKTTYKELTEDLLIKGYSQEEIIETVLDEFPNTTIEQVLDTLSDYESSIKENEVSSPQLYTKDKQVLSIDSTFKIFNTIQLLLMEEHSLNGIIEQISIDFNLTHETASNIVNSYIYNTYGSNSYMGDEEENDDFNLGF